MRALGCTLALPRAPLSSPRASDLAFKPPQRLELPDLGRKSDLTKSLNKLLKVWPERPPALLHTHTHTHKTNSSRPRSNFSCFYPVDQEQQTRSAAAVGARGRGRRSGAPHRPGPAEAPRCGKASRAQGGQTGTSSLPKSGFPRRASSKKGRNRPKASPAPSTIYLAPQFVCQTVETPINLTLQETHTLPSRNRHRAGALGPRPPPPPACPDPEEAEARSPRPPQATTRFSQATRGEGTGHGADHQGASARAPDRRPGRGTKGDPPPSSRNPRRGHLARKAAAAAAGPRPRPLPYPAAASGDPRPQAAQAPSRTPRPPPPQSRGRVYAPPPPSRRASAARPAGDTWSRSWGRRLQRPPRKPLTCWPARGLPCGALRKKEVLAVKKKSSASSSRLL